MPAQSAEPTLYTVDDAGHPALFGVRDSAGHIGFPYQTYGSELTGDHGPNLTRVPLSGQGTITATATVHHSGDIPTPFTVASILLDEGPLIRAVLAPETRPAMAGDRVHARTVADGNTFELRFALSLPEENT